jgi:hypothetical protein
MDTLKELATRRAVFGVTLKIKIELGGAEQTLAAPSIKPGGRYGMGPLYNS